MAALTGVLTAAGLPGFSIFPAAFIAFVPYLIASNGASLRRSLRLALTAGMVTGLIYMTWAIGGTLRYAHTPSLKNLGVYFGASLYHAAWFTVTGAAYYALRMRLKGTRWRLIAAIAAATVVSEWLYQNALSSYPWIIILPYTQTNNLPLLQLTAFGGMWILTFIVAGFNAAIAGAVVERRQRTAVVALAAVAALHLTGFALLSTPRDAGRSVAVALIQENIDATDRWNDAYVDSLAHTLLHLDREAASSAPRLIIWTESAIPWTFRTDDELLNEALTISYPSRATHLVGMLTPADSGGNVFNSIYCIEPDGRTTGRYDKRNLLAFLEKPVINLQLPFEQSRYTNIIAGTRPNIMIAAGMPCGFLICNESLSPYPAAEAARNGAEMLLVQSNDAWFAGTSLTESHLALARLRAVETGRDVIFNANKGYAGVIRSSGRLEVCSPSDTGRVIRSMPILHNDSTPASHFPHLTVIVAAIVLAFSVIKQPQRHHTRSRT